MCSSVVLRVESAGGLRKKGGGGSQRKVRCYYGRREMDATKATYVLVFDVFNYTRFCILTVEQNVTLQFILSEN